MVYDIAGLRIEIKNRCAYTTEFCREYLSSDQTSKADVSVFVTDEQFYAEKAVSADFPDGYVENICLYRNICMQMPKFDRFLLHAAVLETDGEAYAFLGRSGAGKSTHTGLWLEHVKGAKILNGDKPIVHFDGEKFIAYGTPWMGKEGRGYNGKAPLKAFCFIEKARENCLTRIDVNGFTDRIFTQLLIPSDVQGASKTLALADELVKSVPAYVMQCDISKDAARVSYEGMTGKKLD